VSHVTRAPRLQTAVSDMSENGQSKEETREKREAEEVEERSSPRGAVVYKAVRKEGEDELERSSAALMWSALAAGLSMGFSFLTQAMLEAHLPDAEWRPLVTSLGYSVGFLIVVLGRQQLFTENTLTVILPLLTKRDSKTFTNVLRLWAIVLVANLAGAFLFALAIAKTKAVDDETYLAMRALAEHALSNTFATTLLRGIYAGWLIALMVWLLPFAEAARVWVIIIITYVVGLAHFAHIIAGAVEAFFAVLVHSATAAELVMGFIIPALLGNIIGGVSLVAAINHAQVVSGEDTSADM
jgi:formate/nitrite transporter FocA (FNT family)